MLQPAEACDSARAMAATIDGWLTDAEGELLFGLAAACPAGLAIVEIGSWKGKSTVWLAAGLRPGAGTQVFAIDPHEKSLEDPNATTLDDLERNLKRAGVLDAVVLIVAASHAAAADFAPRVGVVFVDGSHLEEAVRVDLDDWLPKVVDGGVLAMHDIVNARWDGPRRALSALLWRSTEIGAVGFVDSIAWMRKVPRNSAGDRLRNRLAALFLVLYGMRPDRLPPPFPAIARAVYRLTPIKRARHPRG
jgi:MMP 1-O-methyltransferase